MDIYVKPTPIVKWAGGKRQLIPQIIQMMPKTYNRYFEPFFGGGALFCELTPDLAIINDSNKQLIEMYRQIRANPNLVCDALFSLQNQYNSKDTMAEKDALYYEFRQLFNSYITDENNIGQALAAALFIFLNKSGFNGLYRVNAKGIYNVPSAHREIVKSCSRENIISMSKALERTKIMCGDFEEACKNAEKHDFVFFDSPYYETFDSYQAGGFSKEDHMRLFHLFTTLSNKGVYCMMTNNNCDFVKTLYKDFHIKIVNVKRAINSDGKNRVGKEVIITNYT